jgi:hypothetical protein
MFAHGGATDEFVTSLERVAARHSRSKANEAKSDECCQLHVECVLM